MVGRMVARVFGVERVDGIDYAGDWEDRWKFGRRDGVLESQGGLGSALPEAREEHEEQTELGEQEGGPDSELGEHVH